MKTKQSRMLTVILSVFILAGCATGGGMSINPDYDKGERAYDKGRYDTAAKHFEDFLNNNPESLLSDVAMYYLGSSYQNLGEKKKAEDTYKSLIAKFKTGYWADSAKRELDNMKSE